VAQGRVQWPVFVHTVTNSRVPLKKKRAQLKLRCSRRPCTIVLVDWVVSLGTCSFYCHLCMTLMKCGTHG